jgi:hypothetical protein
MTPTLCSSPRKRQQQKDSSRLGVWSKSSMLAHKIGYIIYVVILSVQIAHQA